MRTITEVDPLNIPLPPSPDLTNESNFVDFTSPPAAYGSAGRRAKQNGMQSFEGFEIEEQDEETEEEADQVRPIPSLRINTNNAQASDSAPLKSGSSIETTLQTPTSAMSNDYRGASGGERSPERYIRDVSSNSPPKKAPAGPAPVLDRKGSKWRKSVMGIADVSTIYFLRLIMTDHHSLSPLLPVNKPLVSLHHLPIIHTSHNNNA